MAAKSLLHHKNCLKCRLCPFLQKISLRENSTVVCFKSTEDVRKSILKIHSAPFSILSVCCQTHYEVLGIKRTATQKEIRQAYLKLGKELHPDLHQNVDDESEIIESDKNEQSSKRNRRFTAINEAYSVLSRPDTKRRYDLGLPGQEGMDGYGERKNRSAYRTYGTFEERAGAMYGYKIDPDYYKRNPEKYKIAGLCVVIAIVGFFIHYTIAVLTYEKHARELSKTSMALNEHLVQTRLNAQERGSVEQIRGNNSEFDKLLAKYESAQNKIRGVSRPEKGG